MTRSQSSATARSETTACHDRNDTSSIEASVTPTTSNTDTASVATDASAKAEIRGGICGRPQRRRTVGSYNEGILSGNSNYRPRRKSGEGGSRTISGETLTEGILKRQLQQVLPQTEKETLALNGEGADYPTTSMQEPTTKTRKSTRLGLLERASGMVEKTKDILGKRGREAMEAGKEKLQALKGDRRTSLRPRDTQRPDFEEPVQKKTRLAEILDAKDLSTQLQRISKSARTPKIKRWLCQGLYVGQDRDFDPRLTETKDKLKKASRKLSAAQRRVLLPLPMFAGQRTLDLGRNFSLPFDVFSPLPPGQPKPEEWRKTQKNVFVGDAANVWKKSKRLESSTCICGPEKGCDEDCFNRFMFYECDDSNCNIGAEYCTNRSFEELRQRCKAGGKYRIGVEVMKTLDRGYGVRSNRSFDPNQIIVEYTGEIITQDECEDRMHNMYRDNECYYLMSFEQNMIVDATRGSIARFVNHSCEPNCKMIKWTVAGKPRMALFAGEEGIQTGEELTYDYNFDPFSIKNVQQCRCGAASCRGVLGPKPKEIKDALKPLLTGGKRKFQQAVEDSIKDMVKKGKIVVPSSLKNTLATARAQTSKKTGKARTSGSLGTVNGKPVKKVSKRPLRALKRMIESEDIGSKTKKNTIITYTRRRSASGTFMKPNEVVASTRRPSALNKFRESNKKTKQAVDKEGSLQNTANTRR